MNWRDDLERVVLADGRRLIGASFRGVPFLVDSSDRAGGRRVVVHDYPLRDSPYIEDLGRKARSFRVDGYVLGDNYLTQRDLLLTVLEDIEGPGELVHPYHGVRRAVCVSVSVRESVRDGRMAVFAIEFAEAPAQELAFSESPDFPSVVDDAASAAVRAASANLSDSYDTGGLPSFAMQSAAAYLRDVGRSISASMSGVTMATQELAAMQSASDRLQRDALSLVSDPVDTMTALVASIQAVGNAGENKPQEFIRALLDVYDDSVADLTAGLTASRRQERANQEALVGAVRRILIIEAVRAAPRVRFDTIDAALAMRDSLMRRIDEQLVAAGDASYHALLSLRSSIVAAVPGDAALARVVTVYRPTPVPALVLSYQLYGTVEYEADIVARNAAQHPGFLSGDLKVISNV